ncbi:DUF3592 domain-containing protein [Nocardiopsis sp. NRRL B-16309]|uniref:DUF3592 domain-containing protein n=1 Tax=Nocardiopsis sp. NRRL B-16309 TaxID=1519494 RepID=UPI0006AE1442|nr:DUF3592 domain-containing protein [Nocardiopsis sp. NRRL B-16309]
MGGNGGERGGCLSVPKEILGELLGYALLFLTLWLFPLLVGWTGITHLWRIARLRRTGTRVAGRVDADYEPRRLLRGGRTRAPFTFHTLDGVEVAARQRLTLGHNGLRGGQWVEIAYDPADPSSADIVTARSQVAAATVLVVAGILLVGFFYVLPVYALVVDARG